MTHHAHAGLWAARLTTIGALLSGPVAFALVATTHPQPAWQGGALFAKSYHPVQTLPFFCGFLLIGGFSALIAALHASAPAALRARTGLALVFTSAFLALIAFNYVLQTTFVPGLARAYSAEQEATLATFSMSCPTSLAWALEMWGYGLLGVATWLAAPALSAVTRLERTTRWLMIANGPLSIAPAVLTALWPAWVLTPSGLASFGLWNLLVIALGVAAWRSFSARAAAR